MISEKTNSKIVIDGKSVIGALIGVYLAKRIYRAMCRPIVTHCTITYVESEKTSKKNQKVESK